MKDWEMRLEHDRDVINIQCISIGVEIPDHPKDSIKIPNRIWTRFNGKTFWKLMGELGHTSLDFHFCECNTTQSRRGVIHI